MTRCVLEWLEETAARDGDAPAIESSCERMTWAQIRDRARVLGTAIAGCCPPRSPVAVLMEKSPHCVAAMMGAVWAGCFYTPLDASLPRARMQMMMDILHPAVILCDAKNRAAADDLASGALVICDEQVTGGENAQVLAQRRAGQVDTDLLYVLFTSGSTGVPKGVAIAHRSVIDFVSWACDALRLPGHVRFGSQAPFYFDNSVLDIYCAMKMAGSVFIIDHGDMMFKKRLVRTLEEEKIDTIFWVPSALTALAGSGALTPLPSLRRIFFCGEVMPSRTVRLLKEILPDCDYVNLYGPTEITDVCTWYRLDRDFADDEPLPIGFPCENTRILLLDGEICVGGTCLAMGYYNDPGKTEECFVPNPQRREIREIIYKTGDLGEYNDRGELMYLGRRDAQIKRSGYRIELGDIESAVNGIPGIRECMAALDGSSRIVCLYVSDLPMDESAIKRTLRKVLPKYMLPDVFVRAKELPRTASGKLDRRAIVSGGEP